MIRRSTIRSHGARFSAVILALSISFAATVVIHGSGRQQSAPPPARQEHVLGPDSQVQPGVPQGRVTQHSWTSAIYPRTVRDYWVYVPAQYDPATPACVMVFQDGANYVRPDGSWRVPVVFDNLIHRKEMPVTIGIFVNPGVAPAATENALPRFNRSVEYDSTTDRYARFLLDELVPEVAKTYNLRTDGHSRAIGGASSGAIAAFAAAWQRPDGFSRVFSTIGTYVGLRGGNDFPTLIRKTEPKPLRVFLQDGSKDLNIYGGNWFLANQEMLSAFEFAGYDVEHAWGDGGHDGKHGGSILPDALRWLWRGYPAPVAAGESKQPVVTAILKPGEGWQLVGEGYGFTEGGTVSRGKGADHGRAGVSAPDQAAHATAVTFRRQAGGWRQAAGGTRAGGLAAGHWRQAAGGRDAVRSAVIHASMFRSRGRCSPRAWPSPACGRAPQAAASPAEIESFPCPCRSR